MNITRGRIPTAKKILLYGAEGIGKTTFASHFPDPLFIDTEGSSKEYDVARTDPPTSWAHLKMLAQQVARERPCRTLVIDTADWAEKMCSKSVCDAHNWENITDPGYGNGYSYLYNEFGSLLNILDDVIGAGIHVVVTAHGALRKFEQPDERGAYDRWALKLLDTPKCSISHMVMEWADMVLFANYKTIVVTDSKTKKSKAQGGQRVMYTTHHSCWDAKNRYGLPEEVPFSYESIRHVIEGDTAAAPAEPVKETAAKTQRPVRESTKPPAREPEKTVPPATDPESLQRTNDPESEKKETSAPPGTGKAEPVKKEEPDIRIPKALRDLMIQDNILEWDIENFVEAKGFVPYGTKVWEYEKVRPGIVNGLFVAQWQKVRDQICQMRKDQEIPFN